jgi:predicted transglutaminase-like cysteine proteinase
MEGQKLLLLFIRINMTLNQFNNQYKYQTDKDKFGFFEVWDIPKLQDDGFYYGDCESYCLFLKNIVCLWISQRYYSQRLQKVKQ